MRTFNMLAILCFSAQLCLAQAQLEKKDPTEKFEPSGQAGAGQKFLSQMVGDFTVKKIFTPPRGDAKPIESAGTCKQEMIFNGKFLQSTFTFEAKPEATTGLGIIGYEEKTGLFTSNWLDSRQTRMSVRHSKDKFDGKKIVLFGVDLDAPRDSKSKTITTFDEKTKVITHKQYVVPKDGAEFIIMELVMTPKAK